MNKKIIVLGSLFLIFIFFSTGCGGPINEDENNENINYPYYLTYQSRPTKLQYTISHGDYLECTGDGEYSINYDCFIPGVMRGELLWCEASYEGYIEKTVASQNTVYNWEITSTEEENYDLGITAEVISEAFVVTDLDGENALDIEEIGQQFPDIVTQYTNTLTLANHRVYIDPTDENIKQIATDVLESADTNNSFLIAKLLFIWLKKHTSYKGHPEGYITQTAAETLQLKTGDCDELTYLYMSLVRSINIPARFIRGFWVREDDAISRRARTDESYIDSNVTISCSHAWTEVYVGGNIGNSGWIPVECAGTSTDIENSINSYFAIETPEKLRLFIGDGTDLAIIESYSALSVRRSGQIEIYRENYFIVHDYQILEEGQLVIDKNGDRYFI